MIFYNEKWKDNDKIMFQSKKETNCSEEELIMLSEYIK